MYSPPSLYNTHSSPRAATEMTALDLEYVTYRPPLPRSSSSCRCSIAIPLHLLYLNRTIYQSLLSIHMSYSWHYIIVPDMKNGTSMAGRKGLELINFVFEIIAEVELIYSPFLN